MNTDFVACHVQAALGYLADVEGLLEEPHPGLMTWTIALGTKLTSAKEEIELVLREGQRD